jgi:lysine-N-methylase
LSTADESAQKPYKHFRELRSFVIWLLQNRDYSLWKRMTILGSLCDQLHASASETPQILAGYREAVERGLFDQALDTHLPRSAAQLSLVLELIVSRIGADFTAPRFRECYQEFMAGLDWTAEIGMDELGRRYGSAYSEWYLPLMSQHQHILEHYLVNYVHRTLFPLGPQESSRNLSAANIASSIRDQCLMMFAYFAIVQTVSIGMAAFHRESFDVAHVLKIIQSTAKAFEHSLAFPPAALQVIANNDIANCANMAILLLN